MGFFFFYYFAWNTTVRKLFCTKVFCTMIILSKFQNFIWNLLPWNIFANLFWVFTLTKNQKKIVELIFVIEKKNFGEQIYALDWIWSIFGKLIFPILGKITKTSSICTQAENWRHIYAKVYLLKIRLIIGHVPQWRQSNFNFFLHISNFQCCNGQKRR